VIETVFQSLLFLLSFLITYGLLRKTKILPNTTNLIVALVIALYFLLASVYYSENIIEILALSTFALIVVFALLLVYSGSKKEEKKKV